MKAGWKTTEFRAAFALVIGVIANQIFGIAIDQGTLLGLLTAVFTVYTASRTIVKQAETKVEAEKVKKTNGLPGGFQGKLGTAE